MAAGLSAGPVPWWQTSQGTSTGKNGDSAINNLIKSAPTDYKYDPVLMKYVKTPTAQGQDQAAYNTAAMSGLGQAGGVDWSLLDKFAGGQGAGGVSGGGVAASANIASPDAPDTIQGFATPGREAGIAALPGRETLTQGNYSAAEDAAFARAKDRAGLTARGAMTGLEGAMAGRGIMGSGVQGRGAASVINAGQQEVGDVSRQLAMTAAENAQRTAEANYSGQISQRGQDIGQNTAQGSLNVSQRGQDISALEAIQNSLVSQRGQDMGLLGQGFQGQIAQRGQDAELANAGAGRELQASVANAQLKDSASNRALQALQAQLVGKQQQAQYDASLRLGQGLKY